MFRNIKVLIEKGTDFRIKLLQIEVGCLTSYCGQYIYCCVAFNRVFYRRTMAAGKGTLLI